LEPFKFRLAKCGESGRNDIPNPWLPIPQEQLKPFVIIWIVFFLDKKKRTGGRFGNTGDLSKR
jgi:hypothetical protein